jgi:hypothetical protein
MARRDDLRTGEHGDLRGVPNELPPAVCPGCGVPSCQGPDYCIAPED